MASQDVEEIHWQYTDLDDHNFQIHGRTLFYILLLLSVTIVLSLIFLYARWVCRLSAVVTTIPAFQSTLADRQGLDPATINALPITLHGMSPTANGNVEETECCICLSIFQDGEKIKVLPWCQHRYHSECVDRWLCTQSSCPLCRSSLHEDFDSQSVSI